MCWGHRRVGALTCLASQVAHMRHCPHAPFPAATHPLPACLPAFLPCLPACLPCPQVDPKSDGAARDWVAIYDECSRILYQEIDYRLEGANADRFRRAQIPNSSNNGWGVFWFVGGRLGG